MIQNPKFVATIAAAILAASTGFAMAQATGKENNATTGSEPGVGPASGADKKGTPGSMQSGSMQNGSMQNGAGGSAAMDNKSGQGSAGAATPQSTEHSNPSSGAGR